MIHKKDLLSRFKLRVSDCGKCQLVKEGMCTEHEQEWLRVFIKPMSPEEIND